MLQFAGFTLDFQRVELRGPGGNVVKLRPKTFTLLHVFAANPRRVLSKQELMTAVWPDVHVGEDSLFQCVREIRTALGDEDRQLLKSVPRRGYLFDVEVLSFASDGIAAAAQQEMHVEPLPAADARQKGDRRRFGALHYRVLVALAVICSAVGIAVATPMLARRFYVQEPSIITVMPIAARTADLATVTMAANVTDQLTDGLAKIGDIRVLTPQRPSAGASQVSVSSPRADFVLRADLQRDSTSWSLQARLVNARTGQVQWSTSVSVPAKGLAEDLQKTRLTAGIGYPLGLHINILTHARLPAAESKIVVEQAAAFINRTTRERFAAAQAMLEKALAAKPGDVDLEAALAAQLLRGIQMVWYRPADAQAAESRAQALLEDALKREPNYIPALQGYCRFLTATNRFSDSLIACEKALSVDPWDGLVLYHIGLSQLQVGRFEDALATFRKADTFDTPEVSRWTWLLGAGLTLVFMGQDEAALPWLKRSLAITPGTGRTNLVVAAAYQELGRYDEAKQALAKGLQLRPGSNGGNIGLPTKNESARYLSRAARITQILIAAGLPAH